MPLPVSTQRGTITFSAASDTYNHPISAVSAINRCMVFISVRSDPIYGSGSDSDAGNLAMVAELTTTTNLSITRTRVNDLQPAMVTWEVIEFDSSVTIQTGSQAMSSADISVPISSVTVANAFSFIRTKGALTTAVDAFQVTTEVQSSTNLRLQTDSINAGVIAQWTVVEMDDITTNNTTDIVTTTSTDTFVSVADMAKTWIIPSYRSVGYAWPRAFKNSELTSINNIRTTSFNDALSAVTLECAIVEFDNAVVQRGVQADVTTPSTLGTTILARTLPPTKTAISTSPSMRCSSS